MYVCSLPGPHIDHHGVLSRALHATQTSLLVISFTCSGLEGKASACSVGDLGSALGREDPLEKEIATHSSTLAWKIPWTEEPSRLQSMGSQSRTGLRDFTFTLNVVVCMYYSAPISQFIPPPLFPLGSFLILRS